MSAPGRAGKIRSLMLVLDGNIPRFPWEPSTTMLTNRLSGTTEGIGVLPGGRPILAPRRHRRSRPQRPSATPTERHTHQSSLTPASPKEALRC